MPQTNKIKKSRVTSKDVAALAGVSQSTVSRVLSSEGSNSIISEKTSIRVRKAADQLGYSPNPIARALRGQSTNLIGLVVREIVDPFFAGIIEVLSAKIRESGLNMVLGHVHSDPHEGLEMTHVLDSRQCDGMIFLGDLHNDENIIRTILDEKHPVVSMCRGKRVSTLPTVNADNKAGMHMLIEYLITQGHKRIVFVDGGWFGDIRERREVFLQYREKINSDYHFSWVQGENNSARGGYDAMMEISKLDIIPTAVMASDDAMAIGILKAVADLKISIPQDISVTGFDDIDCARFTVPSLTTVQQQIEEMSDLALELLQIQIDGKKIPTGKIFNQILPKLIIRDSSGPCKK